MGILQNLQERFLIAPVAKRMTVELQKGDLSADKVERWATPLNWNGINTTVRKPGSPATYDQLRNMSQYHEISRACINTRKNGISQLDWAIAPKSKEDKGKYKSEIQVLEAFFATIGGPRMRLKHLMQMMVEDWLVIDAVTHYKVRSIGGALTGLLPIDPTTIKILVDQSTGAIPLPPNAAYEQWIRGEKVGDMTVDDLTYDMRNPRTNSPYGLSVIEALILTTETALRTSMYHLGYFADGNIPEGFYDLPNDWTPDQIAQFQQHFDALIGGDPKMQRKIKFMPGGTNKGYVPVKQFSFGDYKPFEEWLMQKTCAMFGVSPQEIGFTMQINKATAGEQNDIAKRNSLIPLSSSIEDVFNNILWNETLGITGKNGKVTTELGPFPELCFKFMNMDLKDEDVETQVADRMIRNGALSVDEWRADQGMDPIGLPNFVMTASGPILVKDILNPPDPVSVTPNGAPASQPDAKGKDVQDAIDTSPEEELKRWEKKAINDLREGREFRKFNSTVIDDYTMTHLPQELKLCHNREDVRRVFAKYNKLEGSYVLTDLERVLEKLDILAES